MCVTALVDIRLISATHRDLKELMQQPRFCEDLYFRINLNSYSHFAPARVIGGHPETGERNFATHPYRKGMC